MNLSIEDLIKKRFTARNFCTSFEKDCESLGVEVEGFGPLPMPLQPRHARKLIEVSKPSKFGFKEQTLYDPEVRKSFEIDSTKIKLGDKLQDQINSSLSTVKNDLLFPKTSNLRADLHNMLIYEKGCFFDFHQDSEKEDGMVATLVVVLPTSYTGGNLVIEYQGLTKELGSSYGYGSKQNLQFIAFYADCKHMLQKVSYGYRIALTFNLILENPVETLSSNSETKLCRAIREYFSISDDQPGYRLNDPKWFVYLLNHQYTPKSLNWKALKGVDKETACSFKQVAQTMDLEIFLTLADVQETWSVIDKDNDYYYRRRRRYWDHENDDFDDEVDHSTQLENLEIEDLVNSETNLNNWLDENGEPLEFGNHYISDSMIFSSQENDKFKPEDSQYEGYMGNYGNTLDRWYKRSAIVMWPKKSSFASYFSIDPNLGVIKVINLLKSDFETGLIAYESLKNQLKGHRFENLKPNNVIDLAISLSHEKFLAEVLGFCSLKYLLDFGANGLQQLLSFYGDKQVSRCLKPKEDSRLSLRESDGTEASIVKDLYSKFPLTAKFFMKNWLRLMEEELKPTSYMLSSNDDKRRYVKNSQKIFLSLINVLEFINEESLLEPLVGILFKYKDMLRPILVYEILNIEQLRKHIASQPKFVQLRNETFAEVEKFLQKPKNDSDLSIDELPVCNCDLCSKLAQFLLSSTDREMIWPIKKESRQHVHRIIDGLELPVSHTTVRQGSPHRLVLKKTANILDWRRSRISEFKKLIET